MILLFFALLASSTYSGQDVTTLLSALEVTITPPRPQVPGRFEGDAIRIFSVAMVVKADQTLDPASRAFWHSYSLPAEDSEVAQRFSSVVRSLVVYLGLRRGSSCHPDWEG